MMNIALFSQQRYNTYGKAVHGGGYIGNYHSTGPPKKLILSLAIAITATGIILVVMSWLSPQKIPLSVNPDSLQAELIHRYISYPYSDFFVGLPNSSTQRIEINASADNYQPFLNKLEEISYANCFHTIFSTITNSEYTDLLRIHWSNLDTSYTDIFIASQSAHISVNGKIYRLISPHNPYNELSAILEWDIQS